jgi:pimeloyl-ACP methyl ester carboxylesterase
MQTLSLATTILSLGLTVIVSNDSHLVAFGEAPAQSEELKPVSEPPNIRTIDHWVPHVSTVPANAGERVQLYVRERMREERESSTGNTGAHVVLFIHGNSIPIVPGVAMGLEGYDWMLALAKGGFDVFAMDHTGYGFSPRPKMDDPCNVPVAFQPILIPNPLPALCAPSYPFRLSNAQSEWDEIDAVVDFLRSLRGVNRVSLIGWSQGGWRAASYASRFSYKIDKLVLLAPVYNPAERDSPPATLPVAGRPFFVQTRETVFGTSWDPGIQCEGQVENGMKDAVWDRIMDFDPIGRTWGPPDGVLRIRTFDGWGWNATRAAAFAAIPTLIISGEFDTVVTNTHGLYSDLATPDKVHVEVQCASHALPWETQARHVHNLSRQWLRNGAIAGISQGKFILDTQGNLWAEE